jgi:hypothetical protein
MTWKGYSGVDILFSNPDNWLEDGSPATRIPQAGDDLVFSGHETQTDCVGLVSDPTGPYASIRFEVAVPVYLGGDVVTEVLNLHGGAIGLTANGQDITVTDQFNWTDGAINTSSPFGGPFTGFLNLVGATGLINPGEGNTLVSGSDLNFEKSGAVGSSVTIKPGTLELRNGAGITVNDLCTMTILAQNPAQQAANVNVNGLQNTAGTMRHFVIRSGGTVAVEGPGDATLHDKEIINSGYLSVTKRATLQAFSNDPVGTPVYPLVQNGGWTVIQYSSQIQVSHEGFYASTGIILILGNPNWNQPGADLGSAKLTGKFWNDGATISFLGPHWRFEVFGDVYWSGGKFQPSVDVSDVATANADMWIIQGRLTIPQGSTAKVEPVLENYTSPDPLPAGLRREILVASQGIVGGTVPVVKHFGDDAAMMIDEVPSNDPMNPNRMRWFLIPA